MYDQRQCDGFGSQSTILYVVVNEQGKFEEGGGWQVGLAMKPSEVFWIIVRMLSKPQNS